MADSQGEASSGAVVRAPPETRSETPQELRTRRATLSAFSSWASDSRWFRDADLETNIKAQAAKREGLGTTLILAYAAIGVACGDLGTSPIYTLSSTFSGPPTELQVLGVTSVLFWAMTLIVLLKYQLVVLSADDHGEGGTFALYSLICRHLSISPGLNQSPNTDDFSVLRYSRSRRGPGHTTANIIRQYFQRSRAARSILLLLVILMTALVIADGILTPAQTVLGAFGAIQVKAPDFPQSSIAGISMGVLVLIFLAQPLGSQKIGSTYAPIILVWFATISTAGIYNIATEHPSILKALSPYYVYIHFKEDSTLGWQQCATIFLCVTGTEASYADLGHFNKSAIRGVFICVLYPSVLLSYFGQAAWIINNPEGYSTSFFDAVPWGDGFFWFYFIVTVLAACVASQCMISAAFSVIKQSMALDCFPRLRIVHTSKKVIGQIFIPSIMVLMMIFTIAAVGIFQNTVALGNSYGVCVSTMMMGTDILISLAMLVVWELPILVPLVFMVCFGVIDGCFWTSNLLKIPLGGWFAVAIACAIALVSYMWVAGTAMLIKSSRTKVQYQSLSLPSSTLGTLFQSNAGQNLLPKVGIFYTRNVDIECVPSILCTFFKHFGTIPQAVFLVTIRTIPVSSVALEERFLLRPVQSTCKIIHVVARFGYTDDIVQNQEFVAGLMEKAKWTLTEQSMAPDRLYVTLNEKIVAAVDGPYLKRKFLDWIYVPFTHFAAVRAPDSWEIPQDKHVELGVIRSV